MRSQGESVFFLAISSIRHLLLSTGHPPNGISGIVGTIPEVRAPTGARAFRLGFDFPLETASVWSRGTSTCVAQVTLTSRPSLPFGFRLLFARRAVRRTLMDGDNTTFGRVSRPSYEAGIIGRNINHGGTKSLPRYQLRMHSRQAFRNLCSYLKMENERRLVLRDDFRLQVFHPEHPIFPRHGYTVLRFTAFQTDPQGSRLGRSERRVPPVTDSVDERTHSETSERYPRRGLSPDSRAIPIARVSKERASDRRYVKYALGVGAPCHLCRHKVLVDGGSAGSEVFCCR